MDFRVNWFEKDHNIDFDVGVVLRQLGPHCARVVSDDAKYAAFIDFNIIADFQNLTLSMSTSATMLML